MNKRWKMTAFNKQRAHRYQPVWRRAAKQLSRLTLLTMMVGGLWPTTVSAQQTAFAPVKAEVTEEVTQSVVADSERQAHSVIQLTGNFRGFIPGTNRFFTYHRETDSSRLHDEQGREIAIVDGILHWLSPDGARFITYTATSGATIDEPPTTYLYDALGNEITVLEGIGQGFSPDGQYLVTSSVDEVTTNLYDATGQKLAVLTGYFGGFDPSSQQVATFEVPLLPIASPTEESTQEPPIDSSTELPKTHLYNLIEGTNTTVRGAFSRFNGAGDRMVTHGSNDRITYLYDRSGHELSVLPGELPQGFYGEDSILVTTGDEADPSALITRLYDHDGQELAMLKGILTNVDESATYFMTDDFQNTPSDWEDDVDYLYDRSGRQIGAFSGQTYWAFTQAGDRLLANSFNSGMTHVYDVTTGDELITLDGAIAEIGPEENQFVVYTELGEERSHFYDGLGHKIRSLPGTLHGLSHDGNLSAVIEYWHEPSQEEDDVATVEPQDTTSESPLAVGTRILDPAPYITDIYDQTGNRIASVEGIFDRFSEDDSRVVTYDVEDNIYRILLLNEL